MYSEIPACTKTWQNFCVAEQLQVYHNLLLPIIKASTEQEPKPPHLRHK